MHALHLERSACGHAVDSFACKERRRASETLPRSRRASRRLHPAFLALWRPFLSPAAHAGAAKRPQFLSSTRQLFSGSNRGGLQRSCRASFRAFEFSELWFFLRAGDDDEDGRLAHDVGG